MKGYGLYMVEMMKRMYGISEHRYTIGSKLITKEENMLMRNEKLMTVRHTYSECRNNYVNLEDKVEQIE